MKVLWRNLEQGSNVSLWQKEQSSSTTSRQRNARVVVNVETQTKNRQHCVLDFQRYFDHFLRALNRLVQQGVSIWMQGLRKQSREWHNWSKLSLANVLCTSRRKQHLIDLIARQSQVGLKVQIRFLSCWNHTLLVYRSASVWMQILKTWACWATSCWHNLKMQIRFLSHGSTRSSRSVSDRLNLQSRRWNDWPKYAPRQTLSHRSRSWASRRGRRQGAPARCNCWPQYHLYWLGVPYHTLWDPWGHPQRWTLAGSSLPCQVRILTGTTPPRPRLARPRFSSLNGFSNYCPILVQASGHMWSGRDVVWMFVSLHPDHIYPFGGVSFNNVNLVKPVQESDRCLLPSTFQ